MLKLHPRAALVAALLFMLPLTVPAHDRDYAYANEAKPGQNRIALAIAKETLERHGIKNPTREQIRVALNGGTLTTKTGERIRLEGVLRQREKGMGWGQIAQANGFKLGEVMRHKHDRHDKHEHHDKHRHAHHHRHDHDRHERHARHDRHDRFERHHRHDRVERHDRIERHERAERYERYERPERNRRG